MKRKLLLLASILLVALVWTEVQITASSTTSLTDNFVDRAEFSNPFCLTNDAMFTGLLVEPLKVITFSQSCIKGESRAVPNGCGDPEYKLKVYNECSTTKEIKLCLQRKNGTWSCGLDAARPGEYVSLWSCDSTGYWKAWSRDPGSNTRFPEP